MNLNISLVDVAVIVAYILFILLMGVYSSLRKRNKEENFFLAGRSLGWMMIGAALFAANISTIQMVGLAAQGFSDGLVWGNFEWGASFLLIILGLIFAPFYFKNKVSTLPEFFEKRYDHRSRASLAFISIVTALFVHIGISLYAGAVVFENFFGINIWVSIIVITVVTTIYTVLGGLKAVVVTESIQTIILIGGALVMTVIAVFKLPEVGIHSVADLKAQLKPYQFSMLHSHAESPLKWYEVLLGYPVLGLYYWCADQTIVQKVLGARTLKDAQNGPLWGGFLKIFPVFIMVLPGVLAYVLLSNQISDPNDTLPVLITSILPVGLRGLMAAALLAALMSTIAAALNSIGTMFSYDIVKKFRPDTADEKLVLYGRIVMLIVIVLAIAWSPLIAKFKSIFEAICVLLAVLSPPIAAVLLWGVFSKKPTANAGMITLLSGFITGITVFVLDFPAISGKAYITDGLGVSFMMQSWWLFVLSSIVLGVISFIDKKNRKQNIDDLTMGNPINFLKGRIVGVNDPRLVALYLLMIMGTFYIILR